VVVLVVVVSGSVVVVVVGGSVVVVGGVPLKILGNAIQEIDPEYIYIILEIVED
jgi:hypothetical protein